MNEGGVNMERFVPVDMQYKNIVRKFFFRQCPPKPLTKSEFILENQLEYASIQEIEKRYYSYLYCYNYQYVKELDERVEREIREGALEDPYLADIEKSLLNKKKKVGLEKKHIFRKINHHKKKDGLKREKYFPKRTKKKRSPNKINFILSWIKTFFVEKTKKICYEFKNKSKLKVAGFCFFTIISILSGGVGICSLISLIPPLLNIGWCEATKVVLLKAVIALLGCFIFKICQCLIHNSTKDYLEETILDCDDSLKTEMVSEQDNILSNSKVKQYDEGSYKNASLDDLNKTESENNKLEKSNLTSWDEVEKLLNFDEGSDYSNIESKAKVKRI